jgi:hypothetical protein
MLGPECEELGLEPRLCDEGKDEAGAVVYEDATERGGLRA